MNRKVAIITGGNGGIGLTLAQRLLDWDYTLRICLACRNLTKANIAKRFLALSYPFSEVTVIKLDVGDVHSVLKSVQEIKENFNRVDYIYLNAGILPVSNVKWGHFIKGIFSKNVFNMFFTGDGILHQIDVTTNDGLKNVFATNVFGHFVLIRNLEDVLTQSNPSQLIWTSSSNANKKHFNINDIQHKNGSEPYSSSKYATDLLSVALNNRLNEKGIYSSTTCPGLVMTNMTHSIFPAWIWLLLRPILWLLRLFVYNLTLSPFNGVECLYFLAKHKKPESLNPLSRYDSGCTVWGNSYVKEIELDIDVDLADLLYCKLEELELDIRQKFEEKNKSASV